MLSGFPSPLHRGALVDGGSPDGRYRENAAPAPLDLAVTRSLWGTEKASQWYAVLGRGGLGRHDFHAQGHAPDAGVSQAAQVITLRNNANTANIGYGLIANELVDGKILVLTGASRGLMRAAPPTTTITAPMAPSLTAVRPSAWPRGIGSWCFPRPTATPWG